MCTHMCCVSPMLVTLHVCVCVHAQRPTSTDGGVASLASRRASADKVEDAVLDMLEDLGRIQADFDPVGWMKKLRAETKGMGPGPTGARFKKAGIVSQSDFENCQTAFSSSAAMEEIND